MKYLIYILICIFTINNETARASTQTVSKNYIMVANTESSAIYKNLSLTDLPNEVWKDIPDYPKYKVSSLGRVKSFNNSNPLILTQWENNGGYLYLALNSKKIGVHQLVCITFLNHKRQGFIKVVNHINFIKTDNRAVNLEVITARENSKHTKTYKSSKYVGVSWNTNHSKWKSGIYIEGANHHLGYFTTEKRARKAYNEALDLFLRGKSIQSIINKGKKEYTSNHKGVSWHKSSSKWSAYITIEGKLKHIGLFKTEVEAYQARKLTLKNNIL